MGDTLSAVWEQVSSLLETGISVIPVRDHEVDGKPPKTPYANWKQYQSRIITPQDLWAAMEKHNTTAIAMICGKISGNLEAIDIDVKNWPGIDARYFEAIREHYPDLWQNLRIHSTPSGGFHILYRIDRPGTGNQKLATASNSTQAGIETRGEGGYIVAPPSLGYQVHRANPIPLITWEQREALIHLAKSFNEKVKLIPAPALPKTKIDFYEQDPFAAYNLSAAGERILEDHAWRRDNSSNHQYRYFIRPGKTSGISASFHYERRLYYIFSTSTALEAERAYTPASLLLALEFRGDAKRCYEWLVSNGFGRIFPHVEQRLVRSRVLAGDPLPANASCEAKQTYLDTQQRLTTTYPHGTYWVQDDGDDAVKINRERLYNVANNLGFRYYNQGIVQIDRYLLRHVTERHFYDTLKSYCVEEEIDFLEAVRNAFEAFIQRAGSFTITRIMLLDESKIMLSDKKLSYKFYQNGFVQIFAQGTAFYGYEKLKAGWYVWEDHMLKRDWAMCDMTPLAANCLYYQFLEKAIGISDYLWQLIGYLAHDYKDETMGYFVLLVEQCEDPRDGGGTGKNLFCNLLSHITSVKNLSGGQVQLNEKLLQSWKYERILVISDVPKHFNFGFFKEISMGYATKKNLYQDEYVIPPHLMPKLIFSTNYSYETVDGGIRRRIRPVEFTPFFTQKGGIDVYFSKMFPQDWDETEWACYDWLLQKAIQAYLKTDGKIKALDLSDTGWLKQFDQAYHFATRGFIQEYWDQWLRNKFISNDDFKIHYDAYCNQNGINPRFRLTSYKLNMAIEDFCKKRNIYYNHEAVQRTNNISTRGKSFEPLDPAPF